jgi:hypothetical protein
MKKLGILAFAALMFIGLAACEKKTEGNGGDTGETTGATANGTENGGTTTTPPENGSSATNAQPTSNLPLTSIEFFEETHNFGEIKEGEKVKHTFRFKNTGSNPLKIENVKASCGCTTPRWTKEEVAAGAEGMIEVEFNSQGRVGVARKTVTVTSNTDPRNKVLSFSGEVVK